jgi:ABC-type Na+ efflux pump permease subunit
MTGKIVPYILIGLLQVTIVLVLSLTARGAAAYCDPEFPQ